MSRHQSSRSLSRRRFLQTSAAAAAGTWFVSGLPLVAQEDELKKEKTRIGLIGAGGMGTGNMKSARDFVDVVAICDVDTKRREKACQDLSGGKASLHHDYREILDNKDISVVHIATPDHWHTKPLVEAMLAGKDVYCEKPLTLTVAEGELIRKVQKETGRIVQVGTQQRSTFNLFTKAIAIVAAGRLGRLTKVQAAIGGAPSCGPIPIADVPSELDWERWLGPAPLTDYRFKPGGGHGNSNCHYEFRWWYEYSGGKLTDWGAHHIDICKWALEANGQTDDILSIGGTAEHPVPFKDGMPTEHDRYNTATAFHLTAKLPGGTELIVRNDTDNGALFEGEKGRLFVNRGKLVGGPVDELKDNPLPEDAIQQVYKNLPQISNERRGHWANFLYCVRERKEPISDVHSHMRALNVCHLAGIAARLGRTIEWDQATQQIKGDELANSMLSREYRKGYEIQT
ncbi:MAG: Gfo/Idh/MocA family oxidoreductase [Planctomycetaceae bacterium]